MRNVLLEYCLARLAACSATTLFATVRKRFNFAESNTSPYIPVTGARFIDSVWQDSSLTPLFMRRQPSALAGLRNDRSFLANSLKALGISSVRGSSSRGGALAVRQLVAHAARHHIVITPDGPRGPAVRCRPVSPTSRHAPGKRSDQRLSPAETLGHSVSAGLICWIPAPGITVYALTGTPLAVPSDTDSRTLHEYTRLIQSEMDQLSTPARFRASHPTKRRSQTEACLA